MYKVLFLFAESAAQGIGFALVFVAALYLLDAPSALMCRDIDLYDKGYQQSAVYKKYCKQAEGK